MRSIWNGTIAFGLINIPVKLYGATEDHDIKAHQLHGEDKGRIRYKRICEVCNEEVAFGDIVRGYECCDIEGLETTEDLVVLSAEDLKTIPDERNRVLQVMEFVPADQLDTLMYDKPYYLAPNNSDTAYALLASALADTGRVGIATISLRGSAKLAVLRVVGKQRVLTVQTMLWPDEVRPAEFPQLDKEIAVDSRQLEVARELIDSMTVEFNPDNYHDTYQENLRDLIVAKALGEVPEAPEAEVVTSTEVDDLLAKLQASVAAKR